MGDSTPIKVRVKTAKINQKTKTRLNFTIEDSSATRSGVVWGPAALELQEKLQPNSICTITNYIAKKPNERFNRDPVEFTFSSSTTITLHDEDESFGSQSDTLIRDALLSTDTSNITCQITKIKHVHDSPMKQMQVREVHVVDQSAIEIVLVLFKDTAINFHERYTIGQTIHVTQVRRSNNPLPTLSTTPSSIITEPSTPLNITQYNPVQDQDYNITFDFLVNRTQELKAGNYTVTDSLQIATFAFNSESTYYGCPHLNCRQKLQSSPTNVPICKRHGLCPSTKLYYHVGVQLMDATNNFKWFSLFDNHMAQLTPTSATSFSSLSDDAQQQLLSSLCGTNLKITIKITESNYKNVSILSLTTIQ